VAELKKAKELTVEARLAAEFDKNEVKLKPQVVQGNRALAVGYVDARAIMQRLDDVVGAANWHDSYVVLPDGNVICSLSIKTGGEWVTKQDVGSQSEQPDEGDRVKAAFSDSLKRAAVHWGIGRYLYRQPAAWMDYDPKYKKIIVPGEPAQAASRPAPSAARQTAPANKPPKDAGELKRRLFDKQHAMVQAGLCKEGDLILNVTDLMKQYGHGEDMTNWLGVKAFNDCCEAVRITEGGFQHIANAKSVKSVGKKAS